MDLTEAVARKKMISHAPILFGSWFYTIELNGFAYMHEKKRSNIGHVQWRDTFSTECMVRSLCNMLYCHISQTFDYICKFLWHMGGTINSNSNYMCHISLCVKHFWAQGAKLWPELWFPADPEARASPCIKGHFSSSTLDPCLGMVETIVQSSAKTTNLTMKMLKHYDGNAQSCNPGLQYPHLHGPVHTPDNNRWDTPPV